MLFSSLELKMLSHSFCPCRQVMTSAAQGVGRVWVDSVVGTDRDCTPTHRIITQSEQHLHLRSGSAASCSCSHWFSCCVSDDGPLLPPAVRLSILQQGLTVEQTEKMWLEKYSRS